MQRLVMGINLASKRLLLDFGGIERLGSLAAQIEFA
jgi:hypothetical protein